MTCGSHSAALTTAILALVLACNARSSPAPPAAEVLSRAISKAVSEYDTNPLMWEWEYGPGIMAATAWEAVHVVNTTDTDSASSRPPSKGRSSTDLVNFLNNLLDGYMTDGKSVAYLVLHNESLPSDTAVGDHVGLFPIAYLARDLYNGRDNTSDARVYDTVSTDFIMKWPHRLDDPQHTFSRLIGWPGQPMKGACFLWADDVFMGPTLLARIATHHPDSDVAETFLSVSLNMQISFTGYLRDDKDGLMYHGYNNANKQRSCCKWGRANGWIMMSHVEALTALNAVQPDHPLGPKVKSIFVDHARAMRSFQSSDGAWHQVVNETSTFLETSVTAMTLFSFIKGVQHGWLEKTEFDGAIKQGYSALASKVQTDGTVVDICSGCGIQTSVEAYNNHSRAYAGCQPGLGGVFRALLAYHDYAQD